MKKVIVPQEDLDKLKVDILYVLRDVRPVGMTALAVHNIFDFTDNDYPEYDETVLFHGELIADIDELYKESFALYHPDIDKEKKDLGKVLNKLLSIIKEDKSCAE